MTWRMRGRSVVMTASLAGVLLALAAYVIQGTLHTTWATEQQSRALAVDLQFVEARIAIAMQEVNLRHYEVEPSVAVKHRFEQVARRADDILSAIATGPDVDAQRDARRLLQQQRAYRALADRLITMVADSDPEHVRLDRLEVTPAFYSLQNDVDAVSRAYHDDAQQRVAELRRTQVRLLVGTSVGFGAGLILVSMILKMALGYQRRLVEHAEHSRHLALHDPLTGLPNRALFTRRLETALTEAAAGNHRAVLMVIDLDGFKAVNDTLGHQAGDHVLQEAGRRLTGAAGPGSLVARLGGDEFAVLVPRSSGPAADTAIGERLVAELRRDFAAAGRTAAIGGSVGIAFGPVPGGGDELFRHADAAMYRAKGNGGGVSVYDEQADAGLPHERLQIAGDLRALMDSGDPDGQLLLHYQPQVRLSDGQVTSVEALVRWQHPRLGLLAPAAFLPAAERGGLEVRLTYHLLGLAVRQAARWLAEDWTCRVSVNVSPGVLADPGFVPHVLAALSEASLPPGLLRLELTETSIMADPERAIRALRQVGDKGVSMSVDDFGTGFSSLAQLRRLPAGELKIDRAFVRDLTPGTPDAVMVRSVIDLGHNLGLRVVAEGVEETSALLRLREMSCDYAQGYALSHPVPVERLRAACEQAQRIASTAIVPPAPATVDH